MEVTMSNTAEITYAIQNDRPSITIRLSVQEEGKSNPDLCDMLSQIQEAITEYQAKPQVKLLPNAEVAVQDVPHPTPAAPSPQTKPFSSNKGKGFPQKGAQQQNDNLGKGLPGSVTPKQIGKIQYDLQMRKIPEKEFCSIHGVACIQDLSLNQARDIIKNEDY